MCGSEYGRIRAMMDDTGRRVTEAGPSTPVEIQGLGGVPAAGDVLVSVQDEQKARQVAEHRHGKRRETDMAKTAKVSLDELYQQIQTGDVKELKVAEGGRAGLSRGGGRSAPQARDERRALVGDPWIGRRHHESDVPLSASNAIIIGFNVRPEPKAAALASARASTCVPIRSSTRPWPKCATRRGTAEPTTRSRCSGVRCGRRSRSRRRYHRGLLRDRR